MDILGKRMFILASPEVRAFFRSVLFGLKKFISFWLMPLPFCLLLIIGGLVLARAARWARLGRWMFGLGLAFLWFFSNSPVSWRLVRPLETAYAAIPELRASDSLPPRLAACRYVVVLGAGNGFTPGVSATGLLSSSAISRVAEAVRLLRLLPEAKLVVSGPKDQRSESHAVVLARAAISLGIDPTRVVYIDQAHDTEDEAMAVKKIAGDQPVVLVTSAWHMPRAAALFRHVGVVTQPAPCDYRSHAANDFNWTHLLCDVGALERSTCAVHEYFGYLWIWLRGKT